MFFASYGRFQFIVPFEVLIVIKIGASSEELSITSDFKRTAEGGSMDISI